MLHHAHVPRPLAAERSPWLRGTLNVPGDAMISHLALIAGALARGETVVGSAIETPGVMATAQALQALGARIERGEGFWYVSGLGSSGLLEPEGSLDFGGSALGLELVMGLCGIYDFPSDFQGDPELSARPFAALLSRLEAFGVAVTGSDHGRLPIALRGPRLGMPVDLDLPPHAPVTKAALLLAALAAPGISGFAEPAPTANHAERLLRRFGAEINVTRAEGGSQRIEIRGLANLRARPVTVPADPSLAAFGAVAASVVPGSEVRIEGVMVNPTRTAILSALVAMGASIEAQGLHDSGGEEVADLIVRHGPLKGVALGSAHVGMMLDELPALAIAAACAEGQTVLNLPGGLPLEAHGRLEAVARGLRANGVPADASEEMLVIEGRPQLRGGGRVVAAGDADLALAFLVLGMAAADQVTIDDQRCIEERFPGFLERFENIGASFVRYAD